MDLSDLLPDEALRRTASLIAAVDRADAAGLELPQSARVVVLRNFTVELVEPFLKFHLFRSGIRPEVHFGDYNVIVQELLDPQAPVHTLVPDVIVIALVLPLLDPAYGSPGWTADKAMADLDALLRIAREKTRATLAVNTFLPPFFPPQGLSVPAGQARVEEEVLRINSLIRGTVAAHPARFVLIDWERLVRILGREASMDDRFWYAARAPFKQAFLDLYARDITRIVRARKGMAKKCLILDCDNTLWGGIVGEDGLDGILLDPEEWPGRAFHEFQRSLLFLKERGVLLALCSRNNEEDVFEVLEKHPHCLLDRSHLAGWRIDWGQKVANLVGLATELNLGLDSFVFVDDSPAECELVRQALPEVTVVPVPATLHRYPSLLAEGGWFDTLTISPEDGRRTDFYRQERVRRREKERFADVGDYLRSLATVATLGIARPDQVPRIAQLTQKTNQFNLTTRRYAEADIEEFLRRPDCRVWTLSVADRFGDMGLTGVFIVLHEANRALVDTLLLSCRVLGRDLELAFVDQCMHAVEAEWGIDQWEAEYIPTRKNAQVAAFWEKVGLAPVGGEGNASRFAGKPSRRPEGYQQFTTVEWKEEP